MNSQNATTTGSQTANAEGSAPLYGLEELLRILPHRPPFLFVDEVTRLEPGKSIEARRRLRPEEPFFAGHFPGRPIMPGVLVAEALAQTSGLLLGLSELVAAAGPPAHPKVFFLATTNIKMTHPAVPGDTLELSAQAERSFGALWRFNVQAIVGRHAIASGNLTLALMESPSRGAA